MKKAGSVLVATAMFLSIVAGCSSGANVKSSSNESSGTMDKAKKEVTLKVSIWGDDNRKRVFEDLGKNSPRPIPTSR